MKRVAALYGGSFVEHRVLKQQRYRRWLAETIYLPDLSVTDLSEIEGLLVPDGSHHLILEAASGQIRDFLDQGGTVLLFGDQPLPWLPGLEWEFRVAKRPEPGELIAQHPDHSFHRYLDLDDIWHYHGLFRPPPGAETLLATADGGAVLYIDRVSTRGTLLVTSLDLVRHVGDRGNDVSAQFLDHFLPWVVEELL